MHANTPVPLPDSGLLAAEPPYPTDDARWQALRTRDARADEHFVFAVRTTGTYARPSRAARLPRRANVEFFATAEQAEAAGYRASAHALAGREALAQRHLEAVRNACMTLEQADRAIPLAELAAGAGMSAFHFHRLFKSQTGLTPKAYAQACRASRLRRDLPQADRVTDAIYDAGFGTSSRFYDAAPGLLGMPPKQFREGGAQASIRFAVGQCRLGAILVAQSARGLCAIWLGDDADALVRELQDTFPRAELRGGEPGFERLVAEVVGFVEQPALGLNLPLDIRGTAFQERVWRALRDIPPGQTLSYSEVAARVGTPRGARAVALACAANTLAVAIPCHRVVRQNGDVSGYRWGVARKQALLAGEADGVTGKPCGKAATDR